jgi:hypothetical protein
LYLQCSFYMWFLIEVDGTKKLVSEKITMPKREGVNWASLKFSQKIRP